MKLWENILTNLKNDFSYLKIPLKDTMMNNSNSNFIEEIESELSEEERRIFESISKDLMSLSLSETSVESQQEIMNKVSSKLSILSQNGRGQVLIDALSDGSSVFCPFCGQVISLARFLCHRNFWCPVLLGNGNSGDTDVEM